VQFWEKEWVKSSTISDSKGNPLVKINICREIGWKVIVGA
jgi:hypothetical protein